jgi:diguanylate cyclase (GGDEF)-like protein
LRIPYLLSSASQTSGQRWRLVFSLFEQRLPLIEGALGLAGILVVCTLRTGSLTFLVIAAMVFVVSFLRLSHIAKYRRTNLAGSAPDGRGPEDWAREFTIGAAAISLLWGITDFWVILRFYDPALQLLVLLAQSGWVGGAIIRNSVSPAVVYCQTLLTGSACFVALALSQPSFVQVVIPFNVLYIAAVLGAARFLGKQNIKLMESEQQLEDMNQKLLELSTTDGLTGIANRRGLDSQLKSVWISSIRESAHVALLMIDVDHFKLYNDRYGHVAGDDCLRMIARCLTSSLVRGSDLAARYGGEEFAALLPGTTVSGARVVAERLRRKLMDAALPHVGSPSEQITVSIGIASIAPIAGGDQAALISLADSALYEAKAAGRNQVKCAVEGRMPAPCRQNDQSRAGEAIAERSR